MVLYGIRNCDTVKKARAWLDAQGVGYQFHDVKTQGLEPERLQAWIAELGWEALLNRRGQTWRRLDAEARAAINGERAQQLMLAQPSIIRRPVLDTGSQLQIGFSEDQYAKLFPS